VLSDIEFLMSDCCMTESLDFGNKCLCFYICLYITGKRLSTSSGDNLDRE